MVQSEDSFKWTLQITEIPWKPHLIGINLLTWFEATWSCLATEGDAMQGSLVKVTAGDSYQNHRTHHQRSFYCGRKKLP